MQHMNTERIYESVTLKVIVQSVKPEQAFSESCRMHIVVGQRSSVHRAS